MCTAKTQMYIIFILEIGDYFRYIAIFTYLNKKNKKITINILVSETHYKTKIVGIN